MTVGELLTAFPWRASVEVRTPCGTDENGDTNYDLAWSQRLVLQTPEIPANVSAREIEDASVFHLSEQFKDGRTCLLIFTK